jgi:hypothetical protein
MMNHKTAVSHIKDTRQPRHTPPPPIISSSSFNYYLYPGISIQEAVFVEAMLIFEEKRK